jgi:hypothetical protein
MLVEEFKHLLKVNNIYEQAIARGRHNHITRQYLRCDGLASLFLCVHFMPGNEVEAKEVYVHLSTLEKVVDHNNGAETGREIIVASGMTDDADFIVYEHLFSGIARSTIRFADEDEMGVMALKLLTYNRMGEDKVKLTTLNVVLEKHYA